MSVSARPGEEGVGVAAAHGDDDVGGLDRVSGEHFGCAVGDVDADLGHCFDGGGVDLVTGQAFRGVDLDGTFAEVRAHCQRPGEPDAAVAI